MFLCMYVFLFLLISRCSLYAAADLVTVCTLKDVHSSSAFEFVACQDEHDPGILSLYI